MPPQVREGYGFGALVFGLLRIMPTFGKRGHGCRTTSAHVAVQWGRAASNRLSSVLRRSSTRAGSLLSAHSGSLSEPRRAEDSVVQRLLAVPVHFGARTRLAQLQFAGTPMISNTTRRYRSTLIPTARRPRN